MNTTHRSHRGTCVAAFLLGALIALLAATPVRSAEALPGEGPAPAAHRV